MSLDTVLKIGNILRNSKEKMSFSNAFTFALGNKFKQIG